MKTPAIIIVLLLFITACSSSQSHYEFWNISKFRIDTAALHDLDEIKLLYSGRGPDDNKDLNYYFHYVAVAQKTGDTVNILSPALHHLTENDKDKVFNYFDENNIAYQASQKSTDELKSLNPEELKYAESKKISKVARDPEFDIIADNHYPTVIGAIGTYMPKDQ